MQIDELALPAEPGDAGERAVDAAVLRRALTTLEPEFREPLVLQVMMGFSVEEIAGVMELNPATVLTRLFRARKKLSVVLDRPLQALEADA